MAVSIFDLFKIGIGPSSSHTVGPMKAACLFVSDLKDAGKLDQVTRIQAELYGSLALTGRGHGTDKAVLMGLLGELPDKVDTSTVDARVDEIQDQQQIRLLEAHAIAFIENRDLMFHKRETLPFHSNGMRFRAEGTNGEVLSEREFYSVGGGFIVNAEEAAEDKIVADATPLPYAFRSGDELLALCEQHNMSIAEVMLENEKQWRNEGGIRQGLLDIWAVMRECVENGCTNEGVLPGGLKVKRRAPELYKKLKAKRGGDLLFALDWVNLWALAVNEENAAAGRVVTAPTNGAAGIMPAVMHYYWQFFDKADDEGILNFLLTAGAVGILFKENASISGAEVGCQGEVGVACSMAAAGLTAALGGSIWQVENAAEIGMEHNLGLTCDPIGGLVQIPCIERNAMGSVKAINAQRMAMQGDGKHRVSLDKVIKTMRDTGADMSNKYKETSRGGLAVNVIEC
jgi:L-serine dehydratase